MRYTLAVLLAPAAAAGSLSVAVDESQAQATPPAGTVFNVYAFGAVGDGKANDTAALQKAIDASVASGTGGAGIVWSRECSTLRQPSVSKI
jgi:polygalacturonase